MHRNKVTVALANKIAVEVPECTRAPQKISRLLLYRTATWLDYEESVYSIYARRLALLSCVANDRHFPLQTAESSPLLKVRKKGRRGDPPMLGKQHCRSREGLNHICHRNGTG
jgi:hypothetical protein